MPTRAERRKKHFHKQKKFLKEFTGTVFYEGLFLSLREGKVVEKLPKVESPDIEITEEEITFNRFGWADNPLLVDEFIERLVKQCKAL